MGYTETSNLTNGVKVHVPIVRIGMTEDDVLASNPVVLLVTGRHAMFCDVIVCLKTYIFYVRPLIN